MREEFNLQRKNKKLKKNKINLQDRISYLRMDKHKLSKRTHHKKETNKIKLSRRLKIIRHLQVNMGFKLEIF